MHRKFFLSLPFATSLLLPGFLLLASSDAVAQTSAAAQPALNPYTGPRYAGGPDSLRAVLRRATGAAGSAVGQLFVRLDLTKNGQPERCYLLPPPDRASAELARSKEVKAVVQQLPTKLGQWQLGIEGQGGQPANFIVLPLYFGPQPALPPLPYSDENPAFISLVDKRTSSIQRAVNFVQRQFRYPPIDLRNQVQGTAYSYFEVSETGAVENRRIVGSLSPSIDAELLRVLDTLPNALTPPRQQGQPVRVAYVLPVSLKIQ